MVRDAGVIAALKFVVTADSNQVIQIRWPVETNLLWRKRRNLLVLMLLVYHFKDRLRLFTVKRLRFEGLHKGRKIRDDLLAWRLVRIYISI